MIYKKVNESSSGGKAKHVAEIRALREESREILIASQEETLTRAAAKQCMYFILDGGAAETAEALPPLNAPPSPSPAPKLLNSEWVVAQEELSNSVPVAWIRQLEIRLKATPGDIVTSRSKEKLGREGRRAGRQVVDIHMNRLREVSTNFNEVDGIHKGKIRETIWGEAKDGVEVPDSENNSAILDGHQARWSSAPAPLQARKSPPGAIDARGRSSDLQSKESIHFKSEVRDETDHGAPEKKKGTTRKLAPRRRNIPPRDERGRFLAFREPTPALSSTPPTTASSRSTSPDSYGLGNRSPTAPTSPPPIPIPDPRTPDDDMPANVEPFWGDRPDENGQDFLRAFNRAMGDKADAVKCKLFVNYLHADSEADEWYAALPPDVRADWDDMETAFHARWPRATVARKTAMEYEEEILALQLKEEALGLKETVAGREVYTHIAWADKMSALVSRAGHATGSTYIGLVRRGLPSLMRERIVGTPANWTAFLTTVRAVDIDHIRDGAAELRKERERQKRVDDRMRTLEAMNSPTRAIRTQLAHTSIVTPTQKPRHAAITDVNPFLTASGGQGNLSYTVASPTAGGGGAGRGGGGTGARAARPPPTEADRVALRARLALMVHHPDTEAGRTAHQAQQRAWIEKYGADTRVTELTPYPLRPGTLPANSNECFGCGLAGHIAPRCPLPTERKLNIREADWRAICRSILRIVYATPVRYVVIDDYGGLAAVKPSAYIEEVDENQGNGDGPSE
ncbi:hypothetical protein D9615_000997 [Tricholomella constricta]|uniref:CCHC-type domain-containing protein n=1 Tax=Tricholomella constricta TaxID=117010 RepID=A0A8H5HK85_9AGAR|nr:hypothetical protein D9615_000997 [Tricholomella constricta]